MNCQHASLRNRAVPPPLITANNSCATTVNCLKPVVQELATVKEVQERQVF